MYCSCNLSDNDSGHNAVSDKIWGKKQLNSMNIARIYCWADLDGGRFCIEIKLLTPFSFYIQKKEII